MTVAVFSDIVQGADRAFFFPFAFPMKSLIVAQMFVSVLLVVSILLQNRGSGLGSAFGSDFGGYYTKRGLEKFLFYGSIALGALFIGLGIVIIKLS